MTTLKTTAMLDKIISNKAADRDLIPNKLWIGKCAQMIHAANVSKSLFKLKINKYFYLKI
jgi:hypothetical protein